MHQAGYAADILYIITLALSKLSTAFLFLRLTPGRGHSFAIWSTICLSIAWAFASVLVVSFRCHPTHPWTDVDSTCSNLVRSSHSTYPVRCYTQSLLILVQFVRWQFIGSLDIITEAALFALSLYLVWGVQMNLNSKSLVVAAFGCRLPYASFPLYHITSS
jgi:hypothetical protein